jgi:hypothetical protein
MARVNWIHERLVRWASWAGEGGGGHSEGVGGYDAAWTLRSVSQSASSDLWSSRVPFDALEAAETERAVTALPPELAGVVRLVYLKMAEHTMADRARRLGMSDQTLRARLEQADARLVAWFGQKEAAREGRAAGPAGPGHQLGGDLLPTRVCLAVRVVAVGEHVLRVSRVVRVADSD